MTDLLHALNEQQRAAALDEGGVALVVAGAGSGKTSTLSARVAYLLSCGVPPYRILLMTFTNRAAREMRRRVEALGLDTQGLWAGTFHHVALRLLRRHAHHVGYPSSFTVLDDSDRTALLRQVVSEADKRLGADQKRARPKPALIRHVLGQCAARIQPVEELVPEAFPALEPFIPYLAHVAELYGAAKTTAAAMDFDDLLLHLLFLLESQPELARHISRQFLHVLVDEFQDTNEPQARIVDHLAAEQGNLMVVGDDAQAIYSFRGARFETMYEFPRRHPGCRRYALEVNYRSRPEILELANASIAHNQRRFDKVLTPHRPSSGCRPQFVWLEGDLDQASFVAARIRRYIDQGVAPDQIAVLYRSHYLALEVEQALRSAGLPYEVRSGLRFFERAHVKDAVAYLRLLLNPRDVLAWRRVLGRFPGIGDKRADRLGAKVGAALGSLQGSPWPVDAPLPSTAALKLRGAAAGAWDEVRETFGELVALARACGREIRQAPAGDLLRTVLHCGLIDHLARAYANARERTDDLYRVASYADDRSLADFLADVALATDETDSEDPGAGEDRPAVVLSTVHRAKGLEFDVVFLVWMAEGKFPSHRARSSGSEEDIEEERRLFHVACTRARDHLVLTCPRRARSFRGELQYLSPSSFVTELPDHLLDLARGHAEGTTTPLSATALRARLDRYASPYGAFYA